MFELSGEIVQVAVALVHASAAAYHTDPTLHSHWPMLGMDRVATFPVEWDENRGSTHGFVASNDEHLVVAFRGSDDVLDLAINLSVTQKIRAPYSGAVHEGFAVALEEVWMELRTLVEEMVPAGKSIWITGHSLGGALATLTATRLAAFLTPVRCFTFGQPRVGDPEFFQDYQVQHHRFVNEHDMIPSFHLAVCSRVIGTSGKSIEWMRLAICFRVREIRVCWKIYSSVGSQGRLICRAPKMRDS